MWFILGHFELPRSALSYSDSNGKDSRTDELALLNLHIPTGWCYSGQTKQDSLINIRCPAKPLDKKMTLPAGLKNKTFDCSPHAHNWSKILVNVPTLPGLLADFEAINNWCKARTCCPYHWWYGLCDPLPVRPVNEKIEPTLEYVTNGRLS